MLSIGTYEMEYDPEREGQIGDLKKGKYCRIVITDTGTGMSEDVKQHVFEPFYTTKDSGKGTGLGLSVAHGIVKNHGGHIEIFSNEGKGTSVEIFLLISVEVDDSPDDDEIETIRRGMETLMLVDDEPAVLRTAQKLLKREGYKTHAFTKGREAVEFFRNHHSEIAAVVLDMIMPDMDGNEVFAELKKIRPDIKVIVASGYSTDGKVRAILNEGIYGFLQKPFKITELCKTIRNALDSRPIGVK